MVFFDFAILGNKIPMVCLGNMLYGIEYFTNASQQRGLVAFDCHNMGDRKDSYNFGQ